MIKYYFTLNKGRDFFLKSKSFSKINRFLFYNFIQIIFAFKLSTEYDNKKREPSI